MHAMKKAVLFLMVLFSFMRPFSKEYEKKVYLWKNVKGMETQIRDTILYFFPSTAQPTAEKKPCVIICPGGSYHHLGLKNEGFSSARWFRSLGVNAFVLQYRVAYNCHHFPEQLQDIQMAIAHVREHSAEYGIDPKRVGAIGFSAGGHLVTMAGEFSAKNQLEAVGVSTKESLRPDFVMPIYPVVSMQDDIAHRWSRRSLLGHRKYTQSLKDEFSMENPQNVPADMPPVFLLACEDDPVVIYENSVRLDKTLSERGVDHVFVSYAEGGHGFGMMENSKIMMNHHWNNEKLLPWLMEHGVVAP